MEANGEYEAHQQHPGSQPLYSAHPQGNGELYDSMNGNAEEELYDVSTMAGARGFPFSRSPPLPFGMKEEEEDFYDASTVAGVRNMARSPSPEADESATTAPQRQQSFMRAPVLASMAAGTSSSLDDEVAKTLSMYSDDPMLSSDTNPVTSSASTDMVRSAMGRPSLSQINLKISKSPPGTIMAGDNDMSKHVSTVYGEEALPPSFGFSESHLPSNSEPSPSGMKADPSMPKDKDGHRSPSLDSEFGFNYDF